MKSNIVLVGLDYELTKLIGGELSTSLDMFFLDINDLIKYNFKNEQETTSKVGYEYYSKQVNKLAMSASGYENTIVNCPHDLFLKDEINQKLKQTGLAVFVNIPKNILKQRDEKYPIDKKIAIPMLVCDELSKELEKLCDVVVIYNGEDVNNFINIINNKIKLLEW